MFWYSLLLPLWLGSKVQPVSSQADTLGLGNGFLSFNTPVLSAQLVKDSQTLYSLKPLVNNTTFDFIPADMMSFRKSNGNYHLGDVTFRVREQGRSTWINGDSSAARQPVVPLPVSGNVMASADLSPTLPSGSLINIIRQWVVQDGTLQLLFIVKNSQSYPIEIGALGSPLEFNNVSSMIIYISLELKNTYRFSRDALLPKPTQIVAYSIHISAKMQVSYKSLHFLGPFHLS